MLESEVPQKPERRLPSAKTLDLLRVGIDAETKSLAYAHRPSIPWPVPHVSDFRAGRHVVHSLSVHLVFMPKYRKRVITPRVFAVLRSSWESVCLDFEAELREAGFEEDHAHLLVNYPPKIALSMLVNSLKGVSARRLRTAALPEVEHKLWGPHFWSPSYCAVSCGGAPLEIIKRYVENQRGERGPSPP